MAGYRSINTTIYLLVPYKMGISYTAGFICFINTLISVKNTQINVQTAVVWWLDPSGALINYYWVTEIIIQIDACLLAWQPVGIDMTIDPLVGHLSAPHKLKAFIYDYSECALVFWSNRKLRKHKFVVECGCKWRRNLFVMKSPSVACRKEIPSKGS